MDAFRGEFRVSAGELQVSHMEETTPEMNKKKLIE